jgi:hypothetical protein
VLTDPEFLAASEGTANAMLDRDVNHPAIILWGFFNEGESDNDESISACVHISFATCSYSELMCIGYWWSVLVLRSED